MAVNQKANIDQAKEAAHKQRPSDLDNQNPVQLLEQVEPLAIQRAVRDTDRARPAEVLALQRVVGNRAVGRLIQPKLTVGPVGDQYEEEADRVADQVMSMPSPQRQEEEEELQMQPLAASITPVAQRQELEEEELMAKPLAQRQELEEEELMAKPLAQRQELEEEELMAKPLAQRQELEEEEELQMKPLLQRQALEEEELLQGKPHIQRQDKSKEEEEPVQAKSLLQRADGDGSFEAGDDVERRLDNLRGQGTPLPDDTRTDMEARFGADFDGVRVHAGTEATQLNRRLQAQAFTHGRDIYFGSGKYDPGSSSGQRLLAHELTHVVQQTGGQARRKPADARKKPKSRIQSAPQGVVQRYLGWDVKKTWKSGGWGKAGVLAASPFLALASPIAALHAVHEKKKPVKSPTGTEEHKAQYIQDRTRELVPTHVESKKADIVTQVDEFAKTKRENQDAKHRLGGDSRTPTVEKAVELAIGALKQGHKEATDISQAIDLATLKDLASDKETTFKKAHRVTDDKVLMTIVKEIATEAGKKVAEWAEKDEVTKAAREEAEAGATPENILQQQQKQAKEKGAAKGKKLDTQAKVKGGFAAAAGILTGTGAGMLLPGVWQQMFKGGPKAQEKFAGKEAAEGAYESVAGLSGFKSAQERLAEKMKAWKAKHPVELQTTEIIDLAKKDAATIKLTLTSKNLGSDSVAKLAGNLDKTKLAELFKLMCDDNLTQFTNLFSHKSEDERLDVYATLLTNGDKGKIDTSGKLLTAIDQSKWAKPLRSLVDKIAWIEAERKRPTDIALNEQLAELSTPRQLVSVDPDGNCFYNAVLETIKADGGNLGEVNLRKKMGAVFKSHQKQVAELLSIQQDQVNAKVKEYIETDGAWNNTLADLVPTLMQRILGTNIRIVAEGGERLNPQDAYPQYTVNESEQVSYSGGEIILAYRGGNHYDATKPKKK